MQSTEPGWGQLSNASPPDPPRSLCPDGAIAPIRVLGPPSSRSRMFPTSTTHKVAELGNTRVRLRGGMSRCFLLKISNSALHSRGRRCAPRLGQCPLEDEGSGAPRGAINIRAVARGAARALRRRRARLTTLRCGFSQLRAALLEPACCRPIQRAPRRAVVVPPGRSP